MQGSVELLCRFPPGVEICIEGKLLIDVEGSVRSTLTTALSRCNLTSLEIFKLLAEWIAALMQNARHPDPTLHSEEEDHMALVFHPS